MSNPMTLDEAIVSVYRNAAKRAAAAGEPAPPTPSVVPGTGRNCKPNRFVPSKRVKALHRSRGSGVSLKVFARAVHRQLIAAVDDLDQRAVDHWMAGKGVRP